jgi:hypothetical protein
MKDGGKFRRSIRAQVGLSFGLLTASSGALDWLA